LIAGVLDPRRGSQFSLATLRDLFDVVGLTLGFHAVRKAGAIGSAESPLVERLADGLGANAVSYGAPEGPPHLASIFDDFTLRSPSCLVAIDDDGLLLARGPFGGRSLYYASNLADDVIVACSRLEPILAWLSPSPAVNVERLAELLVTEEPLDCAATPYRGVSRLDSCLTIRFSVGKESRTKRVPTWPALRGARAMQIADELRETLVTAVERATRPFARVGVMAGGGVDSSGLLALLVQRARQRKGLDVDAYAMDFGGPGDDRPHLEVLARYLRADPIRVRPAEASPILPRAFVVDGMPNVTPGMPIVMWIGQRSRQHGAEAMLTGVGGDDVLDGDLSWFAAGALEGDGLAALVDLARLRGPWKASRFTRVRDLFFRHLLVEALPDSWVSVWRRLRAKKRLRRRSDECSWAGPRLRVRLRERRAPERKDHWSTLATFPALVDDADARGQQECETKLPRIDFYLDAELVEFMASVPPRMFFHDHRQRGLYRTAIIGLLPDSLRLRVDKASFEPANDELGRAVCDEAWFHRLLRMEALGDLGLVEPTRFREAFAEFKARRGDRFWVEFWPALAVEAFALGWGKVG
jgi:asparagine synthase (glutamine-hydrolysing)